MGRRRTRARWSLVTTVALVMTALVAGPVDAATRIFTGSADSAGVSWRNHTFPVDAPVTIRATLDWANAGANLNLFLYNPSGTQVAMATSTTARPEVITYAAGVSGDWRLGVKAKSGASSYTLTVEGAAPAQPGYLTVLFGRTQWVATQNCTPLGGAVDLGQVAVEMQSRGLVATGNVVVDRTQETGMFCQQGYALHPSWSQLADLRDTYGWSFISAGATYATMTQLSPAEQYEESCGSLSAFTAHGHDRAWGLFAYPGNTYTNQIQADVVSTCFAYGRKYAGKVNVRSAMQPPWFQNTNSVNGGACNDPGQNCYSLSWVGVNRRYMPPDVLMQRSMPGSAEWGSIQFYRLVQGSRLSGGQRWDCTAASATRHWTNKAELYCWNDFLTFLDGIPAGTVVTDPATVAEAWGRQPG